MKNFLGKLLRLFVFITYPLLIIGLIVALGFLYIRTQEINNVNATFESARQQLNQENSSQQVTIEDLRVEFNRLNTEVSTLKQENADLKSNIQKLQVSGHGTITGKVLPLLSAGGTGFSQYQLVCAELVSNKNMQICRTANAIEQNFALPVPVGEYNVYAKMFPTPTGENAKYAETKAYYSEYIACIKDKSQAQCNAERLAKPITVKVEAGATVNNIDPIDWR